MERSYVVAVDSRTDEILTLAGWRKREAIDTNYPAYWWNSSEEARNDRDVWGGIPPRWVKFIEWKMQDGDIAARSWGQEEEA